MIENVQEKLKQGGRKQSKGPKICASIRWDLECKQCSKTFCTIFGRQNMQNQTNNFKSAKNLLDKLNTKEDSSKTTISKVERNNRKKSSKQQYNFCKISLELHGM